MIWRALFAMVCCSVALQGCRAERSQPLAELAPPASTILYLDPPQLDLGEVDGGKPIHATLLLRNVSGQAAMVGAVQSSCGCTDTKLDNTLLAPGSFTSLHVTIDPFAKRGVVHKQVTVSDQAGNETRSTITMLVRPSPHAAMHQGKSLFAGTCAKCHAEPALGLRQGAAIYRAVCSMCHGNSARGGYAPALQGKSRSMLAQIVTHGAGNPTMPAFGHQHGGPLSAAQIEALISWLSHSAH